MRTRPAVFLDRDGVLVDAGDLGTSPPFEAASVRILPGVAAALDSLRAHGFELVVVTNQPDVARGRTTEAEVEAVHRYLADELGLEHFRFCPHDNHHHCDCRKPAPGLLRRAAGELGLDLAASWMVGDRWVDIAAGAAAGVTTVLIDRPYSWRASSSGGPPPSLAADHRAADLAGAAELIGSRRARPAGGADR